MYCNKKNCYVIINSQQTTKNLYCTTQATSRLAKMNMLIPQPRNRIEMDMCRMLFWSIYLKTAAYLFVVTFCAWYQGITLPAHTYIGRDTILVDTTGAVLRTGRGSAIWQLIE